MKAALKSFISFCIFVLVSIAAMAMLKYIPVWILITFAVLAFLTFCWGLWEAWRHVLIQKRFNDEDRNSLVAGFRPKER